MRVALLTREFPPEVYGGAGIHVEYLARHLADHVEVAVHCFGQPRESPLVEASYEPWGALADEALRTMSVDLAMAAGVAGADVAHSHTWYANLGGHLAKLLHDIPHVVTTHSLEPLRPWKAEQLGAGYALSCFCERTALEGADAVIAVSERMRADILECYAALDPARVHVVHNGIDTDEYRPDPGTDALERLGVDPDRPSVVFVGRVTRQKGLPYLLAAAPQIDPAAQLVVSAGAADTSELAGQVDALVEQARAHERRVVWIEEMVPRRDLVQIFSHATVFVCPSIYEPFGLVNVEAMACEAPVVATATGGIPEIVVEGETGYLVPFEPGDDGYGSPRDPDRFVADLAERVNRLVTDPELAARFGRAGRERVIERFTWSVVAERTVDLYRRLRAADGG